MVCPTYQILFLFCCWNSLLELSSWTWHWFFYHYSFDFGYFFFVWSSLDNLLYRSSSDDITSYRKKKRKKEKSSPKSKYQNVTHLNKFKFDKRKGYFKQIKKRVKCNPQIKKEFGKLDIPIELQIVIEARIYDWRLILLLVI